MSRNLKPGMNNAFLCVVENFDIKLQNSLDLVQHLTNKQ